MNAYIRSATVTEPYKMAYPNPIKLKVGDPVLIEKWESNPEWSGWAFCIDKRGIKGWVSEKYLQVDGDSAIAIRDYDATEISAQSGEQVKIHFEEFGWAWVENSQGQQGWIPVKNLSSSKSKLFRGMIVEESLLDPTVMNHISVERVQITTPGRWHIYTVLMSEPQMDECRSWIKDGPWYMHFWQGQSVVVVFKGHVFRFSSSDEEAWLQVKNYGRELGIPEEQLDFVMEPAQ